MDEERHRGAGRGQTAAYQSGPCLGEEFDTEDANSVPSKGAKSTGADKAAPSMVVPEPTPVYGGCLI